MTRPKIAIFVSRFGTTAQNLLQATQDGRISAEVAFVASHKFPTCDELKGCPWVYAKEADGLFDRARQMGVSLIALAGWLKLLKVPEDFKGRVVNIHPSLLPEFGGKGMYGIRVHEAVLAAGASYTGCSVHWVDDEYDHGEVIDRLMLEVAKEDTPQILQERVKKLERFLYPRVIERLLLLHPHLAGRPDDAAVGHVELPAVN